MEMHRCCTQQEDAGAGNRKHGNVLVTWLQLFVFITTFWFGLTLRRLTVVKMWGAILMAVSAKFCRDLCRNARICNGMTIRPVDLHGFTGFFFKFART